jgi:hypothetical protein
LKTVFLFSFALVLAFATTVVGWLFVFVAAPALSNLLKTLASNNLKEPFLLGFLILCFFQAAELWLETIFEWKTLRGKKVIARKLLWCLVGPFYLAIQTIILGLRWLVLSVFNPFLHEDLRRIADRALGILAMIWLSTYLILFFANIWPSEGACAWQFPKILSCVLTKYDGLAGGVIGAGGTIFAGWLAWLIFQLSNPPGQRSATPSVAHHAASMSPEPAIATPLDSTWRKASVLAIGFLLLFLFAPMIFSIVYVYFFEDENRRSQATNELEITVCAPLLDARLVVRDQSGNVVEERPIETLNETRVLIQNQTGKPIASGTLTVRAISFSKAEPILLSFAVSGESSTSQSIKTQRSSNSLSIAFDRLADKEFIAIDGNFANPIGYLIDFQADAVRKKEHVGPGCNSNVDLEEGVTAKQHFEYISPKCKKGSGTELDCKLSNNTKTKPGTIAEEFILRDNK